MILQDVESDEQSEDEDFAPVNEDETAVDDEEDELDEDAEEEEEEDELSYEEEEEEEVRSTRSTKSVKAPAKKTAKKPAKRRAIQNNQDESDEDMPFKQQRRRGPKGRPPRSTNYQFVDARLKEIYLLSQPYVAPA
jgi:hypothetical protein